MQNKMLNDEVIESESLAQPTNLYKEKAMNGQYAVVALNYFGQAGQINQELEDAGQTFRFRPLIMQIPNKEEYPAFTERTMWHSSLAFTKEMTGAQLYQYLNWMNVQYTDEWEEICSWGPKEAETYVTLEDGTRKYKDERFNKYFLEEDSNALEDGEKRGLGDSSSGSAFPVYPLKTNRYYPTIYNRSYIYTLTGDGALRFPPSSEHVKNVVKYPPTQIWASIYADIPEVVEYWASREQWEAKIRIALGAKPEDFEARWSELEQTMINIVDVKAFEDACTAAFQPYLEAMGE